MSREEYTFPTAYIQCNVFDWHTTFNLVNISEIYLYENGQHQLIRLVNAIICCLHFICFLGDYNKVLNFYVYVQTCNKNLFIQQTRLS